jgi:hypothetical protein
MAKRPIDGLPPGLGEPGAGYPPPFKVEFDEFDLDIKFGIGHFDDFPPLTGCLCLGGTKLDTVGGGTCVAQCLQTRNVFCLSNVHCLTIHKNTCPPCFTWHTRFKVTCYTVQGTCHTCGNTCGCGTNPPECG